MRWKPGRSAGNTIDARGSRPSGGRVAIPGGLGLVGVLVFVAIQLLSGGGGFAVPAAFDDGTQAPDGGAIPAGRIPRRTCATSASTSSTPRSRPGRRPSAAAIATRSSTSTAPGCRPAAARRARRSGPFYCPADERVYLDLSFYGDMQRQLGAPGDFAWAYVIAHEVGHHVQHLRGTDEEVQRLQHENPDQANPLSVRLELQADCYAGVWAHTVFDQLDPGDVEEAITASEAVGDDRLQRRARGDVDPDSFTHGSSAQRAKWFRAGQASGQPGDCDTFGGRLRLARYVAQQRLEQAVRRVRIGLEVRLGAVLAQRRARRGPDRGQPRPAQRAVPAAREEAHGGGGGEQDVVGRGGGLAGGVVERLGDGLVEREHVDLGAALAQRVGQDVAPLGGACDQRARHRHLAQRLDEALRDRPLGDDVRLHAALAQCARRAGTDRRDRDPGELARVAQEREQPLRAVRAR